MEQDVPGASRTRLRFLIPNLVRDDEAGSASRQAGPTETVHRCCWCSATRKVESVNTILEVEIPRSRSEAARDILKRVAWRGYLPPEAGEQLVVSWELPADQIDLIRSVLRRNRRMAGASPTLWGAIDRVCETIAAESQRTGTRPHYGYDSYSL